MLEDLHPPTALVSLCAASVALLVCYVHFGRYGTRTEPPGPRPLPLLGNLLQVDLKRLDQSLFDLSKTYGPVFTVHLGLKKAVVLAGYKTVRQALVNHAEDFGDREIMPIFYDFNQEHDIIFTNGDSWREMRRFALASLRDFGMGKRLTASQIVGECRYLIEEFDKQGGKAFDNTRAISYAASNVISLLVFGRRFDFDDPRHWAMVEKDHEIIRLTGTMSILIYNACPWLGPWLKTWWDLMRLVKENKRDIQAIIDELKETLNPDTCRCFVDAFLTRQKQESEFKTFYHNENMVNTVLNLFAAGTDTTAITVQWCLLLMAKYPHIQDRVHEELDRVVGVRQVQVEDRKNLPYTDAVIHEVQRFCNVVPMAIPHRTSRDTTFLGYFIEKGTAVFPLLTSVLYDESEWETPYAFNPSHFLDAEGKFVRRDAFMPFSAGRRVCLGESLARMELFLFITSLLQRFRFTPPPNVSGDDLDLTPDVGFTLSPSRHDLCAVSRQ